MPVIGFLVSASAEGYASVLVPVREALNEAGYSEGQNLSIEYRWADYHYDRLPALAADLIRRQVAVIYATGSVVSAIAAKSATSAIPIVFLHGSDPVRYGLVASLNRPGGNVTGVTLYNSALVEIISASSESDFDEAFAKIRQLRADALMVHVDALFNAQYKKIVALAEQYAVPTIYAIQTAPRAGGLISYGTNTDVISRQAGIYIGKILKGAKPADLPVLQPTKFDLIINLKTARTLGLTVPLIMQMTADEVIE
jgi:putative tryptophan/tyrosine transport system substrate-binding protein